MLQVIIEGFHCQSCGNSASKDYQSGDSCHHCGGIVRIETSCAWCAELVPEAKFCRGCGFEMVSSEDYPAARMLKDAGVDKLELKQRLDALSDGDRAHYTQQYDRFSAGINTLLDEMRVCENFLSDFAIGFVKQLHAELLNRAPFSKETSEEYARLAKGPFEANLSTLERLSKESPLENTRTIAKLALLNSTDHAWIEQKSETHLPELLKSVQLLCEEPKNLTLTLLQTVANWRFYSQAYQGFWFRNDQLKTQLSELLDVQLNADKLESGKQQSKLTPSQLQRLSLLKFRLNQPIDSQHIEPGLMALDQDIKFHSALVLQRSELYKDASQNQWLFLELIKNAAEHHLVSDIKLINVLTEFQFKTYIDSMPPRDRLPDYLHDIFIEKSKNQSGNLELIWLKLSQSKQLSERQITQLEDIALDQGIARVVLALEERLSNSNRLIEYLFKNILLILEMPEASDILYTIEEYKEDFDRYLHHNSFNIAQIFDSLCGFAIRQSHRPSKKIITANADYQYHALVSELSTRFDELSLLPLFDESLGQMKITKELFGFFDRAFSKMPQDDKGLWERYVSDSVISEDALSLCYMSAFNNNIWLTCLIRKSNTIQLGDQQLSMNEEVLCTLLGEQIEPFFDQFCELLINDFEHGICDYMFELLESEYPVIKKALIQQLPKLDQMLDNKWYHHSHIVKMFSPVLTEYFDQLVPAIENATHQQQSHHELALDKNLQKQVKQLEIFYRVFTLDKTPSQLSQLVIDYLENARPSQIEVHLTVLQKTSMYFLPSHAQLTEMLDRLQDEINQQKNAKKEIDDIPMIALSQAHQEKIHDWMITTKFDQAWATLTLQYFKSYNDPKAMLALSQLVNKISALKDFEIQYQEIILLVAQAIMDKALFDPASGLMAQGSFVIELFKILTEDQDVSSKFKAELENFVLAYQLDIVHESSLKALFNDLAWQYPE